MKPSEQKIKFTAGFTIIEMIVVLGSFAVLAIISTVTLFIAMSNMTKARVTRQVRSNGDSALQIMERQLRVAQSLSTTPGECGGSEVKYLDQYGNYAQFTCLAAGPTGPYYIASGPAAPAPSPPPQAPVPLTDITKVSVFPNCAAVFTCDPATDVKHWVQINFSLESDVNPNSIRPSDKQITSWKSQINLRFQ